MRRRLAVPLVVTTAGLSPIIHAQANRPQRIVSLIPAATEILFAIGAGADVVGVSSFDRLPVEATTRPRVGVLDPDTERILSLRPTLVVYETE